MEKRIIHICQNYNTSLYFKLFSEMNSVIDIDQIVFYPFINTSSTKIKSKERIIVHSKKSVNHLFRHLFLLRALYNCYNFKREIKTNRNDIIHCHTLFNDGVLGYILSRKFNNQLVISIRMSDIQIYRYKIWLRPFLYFLKSRKVKFIALSPSIAEKFKFLQPKIIGNGVDSEFHSQIKSFSKNKRTGRLKAICIGRLIKSKNIDFIYQNRDLFSQLTIIGDNYPKTKFGSDLKIKLQSSLDIKYHESLNKSEILKELDESDVFVLPSMNETFGIVYLEALSRGIPIINFKNSGVSGLFNKKCGAEMHKLTREELSKSILEIKSNYDTYQINAIEESKKYSWRHIAEQIINVYEL